jgi:hypothetical protein
MDLHFSYLVPNGFLDCFQTGLSLETRVHAAADVDAIKDHFLPLFVLLPYRSFLLSSQVIAGVFILWNFDIGWHLILGIAKLAFPQTLSRFGS